jgi:hypothetical protein
MGTCISNRGLKNKAFYWAEGVLDIKIFSTASSERWVGGMIGFSNAKGRANTNYPNLLFYNSFFALHPRLQTIRMHTWICPANKPKACAIWGNLFFPQF